MSEKFQKENGIDLRGDPMALQRLKEAAENAKKELSSAQQADINLPFIAMDASGPKNLMYTLTRAEFERITRDLLERCKTPVTRSRLRAVTVKKQMRKDSSCFNASGVFLYRVDNFPALNLSPFHMRFTVKNLWPACSIFHILP